MQDTVSDVAMMTAMVRGTTGVPDRTEMKLVPITDPGLRRAAERFDFTAPPVDPAKLAGDMVSTLYSLGGYGLTACQVGLPWSVFAIVGDPPYVCFNPRIVWRSDETTRMPEACLSMPGIVLDTERSTGVRLRFQTPSGATTTKTFEGLSAIVVQHEMCHIEGRSPFSGSSRMKLDMAIRKASKRGFKYSLSDVAWG